MNKESIAELRSLILHRAIAKKLRMKPELWDIPKKNLSRWKKQTGELPPALHDWEEKLNTFSFAELLNILESTNEKDAWLRSSSPFTGILTEIERLEIFNMYSRVKIH